MEYTGIDNLEVMNVAKNYNSFLINAIVQQAGERRSLLDFGAGNGFFAEKLRLAGFHVSCFEIDPQLRRHLEESGFPVFTETDAVPAESIDCAYSLNVLEHIEDDQQVLHNLQHWIRPGGKLLIYVPALRSLYTSMDKKVGHVRRYERHELIEKAEAAGFCNIDCRYVDSLGLLATLTYKAVGSQTGDISKASIAVYDRLIFPASRLFDRLTSHLGGKNLLLTADRP